MEKQWVFHGYIVCWRMNRELMRIEAIMCLHTSARHIQESSICLGYLFRFKQHNKNGVHFKDHFQFLGMMDDWKRIPWGAYLIHPPFRLPAAFPCLRRGSESARPSIDLSLSYNLCIIFLTFLPEILYRRQSHAWLPSNVRGSVLSQYLPLRRAGASQRHMYCT